MTAAHATARVGISGWRYPGWRGVFYPPGLPQRGELAYAAARLDTIEINGTFYALQRPESFRAWREATPEDFVFSVKGPRYITHMLRLAGARTALANFLASGVLELGSKLGPILWQMPPSLAFDATLIDDFLAALPTTTRAAAALATEHDRHLDGRACTVTDADRPVRHALEVRHPSFERDAFLELLERRNVAAVIADTAGTWPVFSRATADFVYARLHGDTELYASGYDAASLDRWADTVRGWLDGGRDAWVYFDNDAKVRAPFDAMALAERLRHKPLRH